MRYVCVLIFVWVSLSLCGLDNDVIKNSAITSSFGDTRGDHFHTGVDFAADGENVFVLEDSRVLFFNKDRRGFIKYGLGNFVVVQGLSNKYRYTYAHNAAHSLNNDKLIYKKGEIIAVSGNTGHSTGSHLHFEIEDIENKTIVNPLKILKIEDRKSPVISDVFFVNQNNQPVSLYKNIRINRGGKLFIKTYDLIDDNPGFLTPYSIKVFIDGEQFAELYFDVMAKKNNDFVLSSSINHSGLYGTGEDFTFFIKENYFLPGEYGIKIVVSDIAGNTKSFISSFYAEIPPKSNSN